MNHPAHPSQQQQAPIQPVAQAPVQVPPVQTPPVSVPPIQTPAQPPQVQTSIMTGTPDLNSVAQIPPVQSQTPPAPQHSNEQIMDAINKINQRLDATSQQPAQTINPLPTVFPQQNTQVQQPAQVQAPAQVPVQTREEIYNDEFYDNPYQATQSMIQKSNAQKVETDKKWESFYAKNVDLQNNKSLVDLALEKHKNELYSLGVDNAFDKLAEYSRGYKTEIVGNNTPTEIVPTNTPTTFGSSGAPVPMPVQQPEVILSFADQMNDMKAKRV